MDADVHRRDVRSSKDDSRGRERVNSPSRKVESTREHSPDPHVRRSSLSPRRGAGSDHTSKLHTSSHHPSKRSAADDSHHHSGNSAKDRTRPPTARDESADRSADSRRYSATSGKPHPRPPQSHKPPRSTAGAKNPDYREARTRGEEQGISKADRRDLQSRQPAASKRSAESLRDERRADPRPPRERYRDYERDHDRRDPRPRGRSPEDFRRRNRYPADSHLRRPSRDSHYSPRRSPPAHNSRGLRNHYSTRDYDDRSRDRYIGSARTSPTRRRSESPGDKISALASGKSQAPSDHGRSPIRNPRRRSSTPPRRDYRDRPGDRHYSGRDERDRRPGSSRRRDDSRERENEADMYGRGGPQRGGYYGQPPQYPPQGYYGPPQGQQPYGRGYPQGPYASQYGSPMHGYSPQISPYHGYPQPSPHYQGHYPQQAYQQQQYSGAPPPVPDAPRVNTNRPPGPPPGAQKTKGGHYANLSWTPAAKKTEAAAPAQTSPPAPAPTQPPSTTNGDDDEEDNPFRPPKDLRAEDEEKKKNPAAKDDDKDKDGRKPLSFSFKGAAEKEVAKPAPPPVRMVKELVIRKRMKPRPELDPEHVNSDSVYYRKDGNDSVIGSGTYGKVYKAVHVYTKVEVALKKIRMDGERDGFPVTAIREIKLLQSLRHVNVVALKEVMVEKNDCFMVFEYLSHDLTGLLNHPTFDLTPAHKKDLAKQLFEGLEYLHRRSVLHRDIKAANILVSNTGQLKLADFGLARFYVKNRKQDYTNRVITIWYRSPELLLGETQYGPAVDIWSAACVLVEIFTKHAIFPGDGGEINQLDKIYAVLGTPSRTVWPAIVELQWYELMRPTAKLPNVFAEKYKERVTPEAFALLEAMFQFDPEKRPQASDVLEHPYFTVEEPKPVRPVELEGLEGDWHEFESKALRKERDREARRVEKERREKDRAGEKVGEAKVEKEAGEKRGVPKSVENDELREAKKVKMEVEKKVEG